MSISTQIMLEQRAIEDWQRWAGHGPRSTAADHTMDLLIADLFHWHRTARSIPYAASLMDSIGRWMAANCTADEEEEENEAFEHALAKDD